MASPIFSQHLDMFPLLPGCSIANKSRYLIVPMSLSTSTLSVGHALLLADFTQGARPGFLLSSEYLKAGDDADDDHTEGSEPNDEISQATVPLTQYKLTLGTGAKKKLQDYPLCWDMEKKKKKKKEEGERGK
ncbi:unnamed protein product, partial [Fusarium fujikuroi]